MLKVHYGQNPYSVIGKYIRDHITAIEDLIAVIEIDGITTNQLFLVENEEGYFIWNNDWYEGEKDVTLIDFFPVSEAINPSAQPEIIRCKDCKNWIPGYITDNNDFIPPKCGKYQQMVGHSSNDFCSRAERRTDE